MMSRHLAIALMLSTTLLAAPAALAAVYEVQMTTVNQEPRFVPDDLTIRPGDTVRWTNTDPFLIDHATTSGTGAADPQAGIVWESGTLVAGQSFEHTFTEAGEYEYFSVPHEYEGMFGIVRVNTSLGVGGEITDSTWGMIKARFDSILPKD